MSLGTVQFDPAAGGYRVGRPRGRCCLTGRDIPPGGAYVAALRDDDGGGYERCDFHADAWDELDDPARRGFVGTWRGVMPDRDAKPAAADDGTLLELVDSLDDDADRPDRNRAALRFVLCLMLLRRRKLTFVDADDAAWTLRRVGGGEVRVADPGLDDAAVERVRGQIEALVRGEAA